MPDEAWVHLSGISAGNKKFVSEVVSANDGNGNALALTPSWPSLNTFGILHYLLTNRSGGTTVVGLAVRLPRDRWGAGQVTTGGVFTDDTTDAQDVGTGDFGLHNGAESGSGFVIHADCPFNVIGIVQSTLGDQVTPVLVLEVWDGTGWVDITTAVYSDDDLNPGATNERLICFARPPFWVKGGSGVGIRQDRYNARIRYTTSGAGTVSPAASQIFVGVSVVMWPDVADGSYVSAEVGEPLRAHRYGDALFPFFGTAGYDNLVDVTYCWL